MDWNAVGDHIVNRLDGYLAALGSIAVAIVAIFGDQLKRRPKVILKDHSLKGGNRNAFPDGSPVAFFHLAVKNTNNVPVRNCRVVLVGISRKSTTGQFVPSQVAVPWQCTWSPSETSPILQSFIGNKILDFGFLTYRDKLFSPALYVYPNTFREYGIVRPGETVQYALKIEADNFIDKKTHLIEVSIRHGAPSSFDELLSMLEIRPISL